MSTHLHDDDRLQTGEVGNWRTVKELRAAGYTEGELEVMAEYGTVERRTLRTLNTSTFVPVPDSFSPGISALRAAEAEATEPFSMHSGVLKERAERRAAASAEDDYKAKLASQLAAQRSRMSAHIDARPSPPRLTTAELKSYAAPDAYAQDLQKLRREEERHR